MPTSTIWKTDPSYPPLLHETADPPARLFLEGQPLSQADRYLAVVGTRHASPYGREMAAYFTAGLARRGFVIVSGLAYGIDTIAHETALKSGGRTIAILGAGFDHLTPTCNRLLAEEIKKNGAVITEYEKDIPPYKGNFPKRNRIIAGMSLGTLVIEGPERSGSLITARLALEYNREVFAIPANITNVQAAGTNRLISQGVAHPVTSVESICEILGLEKIAEVAHAAKSPTSHSLTAHEKKIYTAIKKGNYTIDELILATALRAPEINATLSKLELTGAIKSTGGAFTIPKN